MAELDTSTKTGSGTKEAEGTRGRTKEPVVKKRIDELVRETYSFDAPEIICSTQMIEKVLEAGTEYSETIRVKAGDGTRLRGYVYADSKRIQFEDTGIGNGSIHAKFDITGLADGDIVSGNIYIEADAGEIKIPVKLTVYEKDKAEDFDDVQALEDFSKLANKNPRQAFGVFISSDFPVNVLNGKNTPYRSLYKGLSANPVTYQHMEEFLVATGKKEPVRISTDKQEKSVYKINTSLKDTLYIYRNTWGYCSIDVEVTGDFIEVEKKNITSDDFIGKIYGLEYVINKDRLSALKSRGRIALRTPYDEIVMEIEAKLDDDLKLISKTYRKKRLLKLARNFLALQLRKMDYHTWYEDSLRLVEELKEEKEDSITLFADAYLAYCNDDNVKAAELLLQTQLGGFTPEQPWEKALYLYLSKRTGLLPKEKTDISRQLYAYYQEEPDNCLLLALYMKEDESVPYKPVWGLTEYEKAFKLGCCSPFLYFKAWKEFDAQESLLRKLTPFTLRVLLFAQREGVLSESLLKRAGFLSTSDKEFRPALYQLLKNGYEQYPGAELLEAVCRYVMKDSTARPSYFTWYEKAVESGIKLTLLYEHYMDTRADDDYSDLPQQIKLYFSANDKLGDKKKAYFYALIVKNKDKDPATFNNLKAKMGDFAVKNLMEGKISDDLSVLYSEFLVKRKDLEIASAMAKVLFTHRLRCSNKNIRRVIVCHPSLNEEASYELNDGEAFPNIYGPDASILLEDDRKRRFAATIPYTIEPLIDVKTSSRACVDMGVWDTGLQLYCCHERGWQMDVNSRTVLSFLKAAENPEFTRKYRDTLRGKLLTYFYRQIDDPYASSFADRVREITYGQVNKKQTFEILMHFEQYKKAFNLVNILGYEGIDDNMLLELAQERIYSFEYNSNDELLSLCEYLFGRGKYTDRLITYLVRYYAGSPEAMEVLWKKAKDVVKDISPLEERLLITSMFVHYISDRGELVLDDYAKAGGNSSIIRAYLTYLSIYYLLEGRRILPSTARYLAALSDTKDDHLELVNLAWLKYEAVLENIPEADKPRIKKLLKYCSDDGLRFSFMQNFTPDLSEGMDIADRTFIEERFPCGSTVLIHFRTDDGDFRTEPMKELVKGIYGREFLLFYNETLEYYCSVKKKGEYYDTEIKKVTITRAKTKGKTSYHILNRVLAAMAAGANTSAEEEARMYLKQEACAEKFFDII